MSAAGAHCQSYRLVRSWWSVLEWNWCYHRSVWANFAFCIHAGSIQCNVCTGLKAEIRLRVKHGKTQPGNSKSNANLSLIWDKTEPYQLSQYHWSSKLASLWHTSRKNSQAPGYCFRNLEIHVSLAWLSVSFRCGNFHGYNRTSRLHGFSCSIGKTTN